MPRLFIAIRPPADQRAWLMSLATPLAGARWQDDDQLHLTLRFVGDVDAHGAQDIADALRCIVFAPIECAVRGVGTFERKGRVDALWAGVHPRDPLSHLHRKIDRACISVGLPPESRAYLPHITLARFGRQGGAVDPFLAHHAALAGMPFRIDSFGLYESVLGRAGATYHVMDHFRASSSPGISPIRIDGEQSV
ncbi:RNA 2',3'-cyclic phosphodiesterase [Sphingobium sp.]|uniref:RNA 2',3'-cyclic phosphodiesterase n=1 Tax=Sphingobium sp. TaxID=1912891 RepID=UPI003BB629BE